MPALYNLALVLVLVGTAAADPAPPHGIKHVAIAYRYTSFHQNELSYSLLWKDGAYHDGSRTVAPAAVEALFAALTDLKPTDRALQCTSHTDDYPELTVTLGEDAWTPKLSFNSSSNCHLNVPWNIVRDGKRFVQFTGAAGRAVRALLVAVDPDHWTHGPDTADASTSGPVAEEPIWLDDYKADDKSVGRAGACAHDLETSAQAQQFFGAPPHVTELTLLCDLVKSADCSVPIARTELAWAGLDATVDIPCTNGKIALTKELVQVRDFVTSKVVRTALKLAGKARLWPAWGTWELEAGSLPHMEYTPGTQVIELRAVNQDKRTRAFWSALGIRILKTGPGNVTELKVDFTGKVR